MRDVSMAWAMMTDDGARFSARFLLTAPQGACMGACADCAHDCACRAHMSLAHALAKCLGQCLGQCLGRTRARAPRRHARRENSRWSMVRATATYAPGGAVPFSDVAVGFFPRPAGPAV